MSGTFPIDERARLVELLRRHGLRTSKSLGQHFLIDTEVLYAIAHSLAPGADSTVVEIGSGAGNLTLMLALSGAEVIGLEVDRKFETLHREIQLTHSKQAPRLSWIYEDALAFDYAAVAQAAEAAGRRFLIAGNIPYQITSPLIMHILETGAVFNRMVLMMQREVAERLTATPGGKKSGAITIKVQYYCELETLLDVPPESFLPPPEVHSRVVSFTRRATPAGIPPFFRIVDAAFMYRRKTLPNAISSSGAGYTREQIECALVQLGHPITARAEQLNVREFESLYQYLTSSG